MYLDLHESSGERNALPIGLAKLTRLAFAGISLDRIAGQLLSMFERDPSYVGALMDLSVIDQLNGNLEIGLTRQALALSKQRLFHSTCCGVKPSLRLLAFVTAADIGANTPLEFLLEGSDIALTMAFVLPGRPLPKELPEHDIAFVAIAANERNRAVLSELDEMLTWWPVPVINFPDRISMSWRDALIPDLHSVPGLRVPPALRFRRKDLQRMINDKDHLRALAKFGFPVVIKPADATAGRVLSKVEDEPGLSIYLESHHDECFLISPFIDSRSNDGQFRKYRILFINRRAYACHMAISDQWNTHYFDARMDTCENKRSEEARFIANFDEDFAKRHCVAIEALSDQIGLSYFAIDCAEASTGELVIFKADHTLLVHDMDPVDVFPYKPAQMRKIFDAFAAFLHKAANGDQTVDALN
jgi:glutathione synthase/RimK-type ligase-like ATP-grasp enzyme